MCCDTADSLKQIQNQRSPNKEQSFCQDFYGAEEETFKSLKRCFLTDQVSVSLLWAGAKPQVKTDLGQAEEEEQLSQGDLGRSQARPGPRRRNTLAERVVLLPAHKPRLPQRWREGVLLSRLPAGAVGGGVPEAALRCRLVSAGSALLAERRLNQHPASTLQTSGVSAHLDQPAEGAGASVLLAGRGAALLSRGSRARLD